MGYETRQKYFDTRKLRLSDVERKQIAYNMHYSQTTALLLHVEATEKVGQQNF